MEDRLFLLFDASLTSYIHGTYPFFNKRKWRCPIREREIKLLTPRFSDAVQLYYRLDDPDHANPLTATSSTKQPPFE
jgi:hypothetical protein